MSVFFHLSFAFNISPSKLTSSMASDSHTPTAATIPEKPLAIKVSEEAKLMEKEIVSSDSADVVNDKPTSDSIPEVTKEEKIDQTPGGEPEKESPAAVEVARLVVKAEEFIETEKDENGEKVAAQVELKEPILVKEGVEEVIVEAVGAEKAEEKPTVESVVEEDNKDKEVESVVKEDNTDKEVERVVEEENKDMDETKIVDVSESTDEAGGKQVEPVNVQSIRDVSAETAKDNIKDVEALEVEPKPEASAKVETQPEKAKELAPEGEAVKAEETPETTEQTRVELQGKLEDITVKAKDSGINSKDEKTSPTASALCPEERTDTDPKKETEGDASSPADVIEKTITVEKHVVDEPSKDENTSESDFALCPEKVVPTNQDSDTEPKKETERGASPPADVIEKAITEEKHVVGEPSKDETTSESGSAMCPEKVVPRNQDLDMEPKKDTEGEASSHTAVIEKAITEEKHVVKEPSKDEQESVSEAKDVITNLATEDENIKKDNEPPVADGKSEETLEETETESGEKETTANKQEESITEKVAEVVETAPVVKENDEPKQQQPDVTTKEVAVKQKHSNSIISKVKQSLVKAKKAIIGKSPSSKTISTEEFKGEIKVK